jgi:hypothetical protein
VVICRVARERLESLPAGNRAAVYYLDKCLCRLHLGAERPTSSVDVPRSQRYHLCSPAWSDPGAYRSQWLGEGHPAHPFCRTRGGYRRAGEDPSARDVHAPGALGGRPGGRGDRHRGSTPRGKGGSAQAESANRWGSRAPRSCPSKCSIPPVRSGTRTGVASRRGWLSTRRCIGPCRKSCLGWPFYAASVWGAMGPIRRSTAFPCRP